MISVDLDKVRYSDDVQKFLDKYAYLIKDHDYQRLYNFCGLFPQVWEVSEILYAAGIDPLKYMEEVPSCFIASSAITGSVVLGANIKKLAHRAFVSCHLHKIAIPNTISELSGQMFKYCDELEHLILTSSIKRIGSECFSMCKSLQTIFYNGTIQQWRDIDKSPDFDIGTPIYKVVCSDGELLRTEFT